jgi:6-pyruvoyltetrahydropterin/6-carboxytetrahydropterin synthase
MYEVSKQASFSGAHSLREYKGKCESVHGHNWKIKAFVAAQQLDNLGMVVDFTVLGARLNEILERLDHKDINAVPPFDTINPSSENIAKYIYDELSGMINDGRVKVSRVMVWETDPSCAIYSED